MWDAILSVFREALTFLHDLLEAVPFIGTEPAWGFAIIALTVLVRLLLLPLAIKQTRSMRAMQALQPQIKRIQEKYKTDRDMMRKDPERYRQRKAKANEEMMALYKEEGVNPAAGCLPLLAQAPIFFALFSVLRSFEPLQNAQFYFFTDHIGGANDAAGLGAYVRDAGWPGWLLIVLMALTMFISQRQMTVQSNAEGVQAQQQKILMYVMPVFLAFISQSLPLGVLLYWVTTNLWQMGQQAIILHEVHAHPNPPGDGRRSGSSDTGDSKSSGRPSTSTRGGGDVSGNGSGRRGADSDRKRRAPANKPAKGGGSQNKPAKAGGNQNKPANGSTNTSKGSPNGGRRQSPSGRSHTPRRRKS